MLTLTRRSEVPRPESRTMQPEAEAPPSRLGPGVGIQGVLEIDGELVISGLVKGRIAASKLVIAPGGYVEGDIVAREVVISGRPAARRAGPPLSHPAPAPTQVR